jgi:hypothetical protein
MLRDGPCNDPNRLRRIPISLTLFDKASQRRNVRKRPMLLGTFQGPSTEAYILKRAKLQEEFDGTTALEDFGIRELHRT